MKIFKSLSPFQMQIIKGGDGSSNDDSTNNDSTDDDSKKEEKPISRADAKKALDAFIR